MPTYLFPDNTVMINFAVIDRLDLLRRALADQGRVTGAVHREIKDSASFEPALGGIDLRDWFGDPIAIKGSEALKAVNRFRVGRFAGPLDQPRKHLGESETLYLLTEVDEFASSIIITDDGSAYRLAKGMLLNTKSTVDVLRDAVMMGACSASEATGYVQQLLRLRDNLIDPPMTDADW